MTILYSSIIMIFLFSTVSIADEIKVFDSRQDWTQHTFVKALEPDIWNDYASGTLHVLYEIYKKPSDITVYPMICVWEDKRETCTKMAKILEFSRPGVYTAEIPGPIHTKMWNAIHEDMYKPGEQVTRVLHQWWVKKNGANKVLRSACCDARIDYGNGVEAHIPIDFRAIGVLVKKGDTFSGWKNYVEKEPPGLKLRNGSTSPETVQQGTVQTVNVTIDAYPLGGDEIKNITLDLSSFGGKKTHPMAQKDKTTWTTVWKTPKTMEPGTYRIPVLAACKTGITASALIGFSVTGIAVDTLESTRVEVKRDTYIGAIDTVPNENEKEMRLKTWNQGVMLLDFDLSTIDFVPDSAVIVLQPSDLYTDDYDFSAVVHSIQKDWYDNPTWTGTSKEIDKNLGKPHLSCPSACYIGNRFVKTQYCFPVSKEIIQSYAAGKCMGVAIQNVGKNGANNQFFSKENGKATAPYMLVYKGKRK